MKTMSRTGADVARGIALLTIVPLILSAVAPPSLVDSGGPVDDVDAVVEMDVLPEADAETKPLIEAPVEPEVPVVEEEPLATMTREPEEPIEEITDVVDQHCDDHTTTPKVEASGKPASADETITVDGIDVRVVVSGKTVSFFDVDGNPLVVTFCVKASTATSGSQQGSSYTVDFVNPAGEVPEISYVVVYSVEQEPPPAPDTVTIELVKQWFDVDGDPTDAPDVDWGIQLYTTLPDGSDQTVASLPGENSIVTFAFDDEGYPARYGVVESPVPQGWETSPCEDLPYEGESVVATDTSAIQSERAEDGSFPATDSGVHLVCNQELPPAPPVIRPPRPVEPETVNLGLVKVWLDADGEVLPDPPDADFAVTLSVDDQMLATVDGDSPTDGVWLDLEVDTAYVVAEPTLPAGWEVATCPVDVAADGAVAHGLGTFTVEGEGRHLVCNQAEVEVAPIVIEQPEPEPTVEPTPVAEPEAVEEPEVRGEVIEAQLPRTGLGAVLLTLLALLLSAAGLVVVVATRRPTLRR